MGLCSCSQISLQRSARLSPTTQRAERPRSITPKAFPLARSFQCAQPGDSSGFASMLIPGRLSSLRRQLARPGVLWTH